MKIAAILETVIFENYLSLKHMQTWLEKVCNQIMYPFIIKIVILAMITYMNIL